MISLRIIISAVIAIAVVAGPVATAWVVGANATSWATHHSASHTGESKGGVAQSPMEDCASMMKSTSKADECPCCDKEMACPPQFCTANCLQFLGLAQQWRPIGRLVTARLRPTVPAHPPDWSDQPQLPPPRT